jgi:hypothetical protein
MLGDIFEAPRQVVVMNADVNTANRLIATIHSSHLLNANLSEDLAAPVILGVSYVARGANWGRDVVLTLTEKAQDGSNVKSTTVTLPARNTGRSGMVQLANEFQAAPGNFIEVTVTTTANATGATADIAINYIMSVELLPLRRQVIGEGSV